MDDGSPATIPLFYLLSARTHYDFITKILVIIKWWHLHIHIFRTDQPSEARWNLTSTIRWTTRGRAPMLQQLLAVCFCGRLLKLKSEGLVLPLACLEVSCPAHALQVKGAMFPHWKRRLHALGARNHSALWGYPPYGLEQIIRARKPFCLKM